MSYKQQNVAALASNKTFLGLSRFLLPQNSLGFTHTYQKKKKFLVYSRAYTAERRCANNQDSQKLSRIQLKKKKTFKKYLFLFVDNCFFFYCYNSTVLIVVFMNSISNLDNLNDSFYYQD